MSLAVVTGASSGIGEALARGLARRGFTPVLVARRADRLERLAAELGGGAEVRPCDLGDAAARAALAAELREREIAVLVNNAGFGTHGATAELDPDREAEMVAVNAVAVHELTLAVLPQMVARGEGGILVVGSTAGWQPLPRSATYAASKAFANHFAESLHAELAPEGIRVTLLAPGPVRTEFVEEAGLGRWDGLAGSVVWTTAEENAEAALDGLQRGRRVVAVGAWAKGQTLFGRHTPRAALLPILRRTWGRLT